MLEAYKTHLETGGLPETDNIYIVDMEKVETVLDKKYKDGTLPPLGNNELHLPFDDMFIETLDLDYPLVIVPSELSMKAILNTKDNSFIETFRDVDGTLSYPDIRVAGIFLSQPEGGKIQKHLIGINDKGGLFSMSEAPSKDGVLPTYIDKICEEMVHYILLHTQPADMEISRRVIKARASKGKKRKFKIGRVVYLGVRGPKATRETHVRGYKLRWTHRFWVRGHWRKVPYVGKNRHGDYCVKGFTWVEPHIKGPENTELVNKIRIVR